MCDSGEPAADMVYPCIYSVQDDSGPAPSLPIVGDIVQQSLTGTLQNQLVGGGTLAHEIGHTFPKWPTDQTGND